MSRRIGTVKEFLDGSNDLVQRFTTEHGQAMNFTEMADKVEVGNSVLLNCTATDLKLGTGGWDFVIARLNPPPTTTEPVKRENGHLMCAKYTPVQYACRHLDEQDWFPDLDNYRLDELPITVAEIHSQIAPISSAIEVVEELSSPDDLLFPLYIMTDSAALSLSISDLVKQLMRQSLIVNGCVIGQGFGQTYYKTVSLHNALLFTRADLNGSPAIVAPGPGQTGTGTKYGFSGIEQASNLDIVAALGGTPIACVRASSADKRERHQGISHHTKTVLELVRSGCIVPIPEGLDVPPEWLEKHDVRIVPREKTQPALDLLKEKGINVTTMGRSIDEDPLFFHAAAAAGTIAAEIALELREKSNG